MLRGRRRKSVTEYEYDDGGRLVRAVTTHDPEFTDDDYLAVLDRARDRALRCSGCGLPADEVWHDHVDPKDLTDEQAAQLKERRAEMKKRYRPETRVCTFCEQVDDQREGADRTPGLHTVVADG